MTDPAQSDPTPIDAAHAAMAAAPEDQAARRRFYERIADAELFLMLAEDPVGETLIPETFALPEATVALAFDRESRLADFAGRPVPYASLSGRTLAGLLAGADLGLGLNLDVAPSSILIPADAVAWLADTVSRRPDIVEAQIAALHAPTGLPEALLHALDAKLAAATGLARAAYLVGVGYRSGAAGHLLGFVDAPPGAEAALARAVHEALGFSGLEAGALDVGFFAASDAIAARLAARGLRIDLPQAAPSTAQPAAPGSDPDRPPILR